MLAAIATLGCGGAEDAAVGAVTTQRSALSTSFPPYLTIPAYMHPDSRYDTEWAMIANAAGGYVIVNRASGPGPDWSADLANRIAQLSSAGWLIYAYVDDHYDRPAADIQNDINAWVNFYGTTINGIFFDNAARSSTQFDIGKSIYLVVFTEQVVESYHAIFNWGAQPRGHYVNCVGTIFDDVNNGSPMVSFGSWETYESTYTNAANWNPKPWLNNYRADHFIHIIHDATPDGSTVPTIASLMQSRNASSVYMTNFKQACVTTADCNVPGSTCVANQCVDSAGNPANIYSDMPASALWNAESTTFVPSNTSMSFPSSTTDPPYFSDCPGEIAWCSHDVCGQGSALAIDCDASWNDCTRTVCTTDSHCCSTTWDASCVNEAVSWCSGVSCPTD